MSTASWTPARRWVFALKPASWPRLLVPMVLGLVIGSIARGATPPGAVVVVVAFTVALLVFVVLMNDIADERVDALKRRMFPDAGSPKTLADGILDRQSLLIGGVVAGTYAIAASVAGALALDRAGLVPLSLLGLALFAGYSLPPFRMNYRGGGEALEAVGVGIVLPWYAAHAVSGSAPAGAVLLPGLSALALASAIASGLGDEASDRRGGKRTIVSVFGNPMGRRATEIAMALGAALWGLACLRRPEGAPWSAVLVAAAVVLAHWVRVQRLSDAAKSRNFDAISRYKNAVNEGVRDGALVLAVGLLVVDFIQGR